jgi:hypothetical protein
MLDYLIRFRSELTRFPVTNLLYSIWGFIGLVGWGRFGCDRCAFPTVISFLWVVLRFVGSSSCRFIGKNSILFSVVLYFIRVLAVGSQYNIWKFVVSCKVIAFLILNVDEKGLFFFYFPSLETDLLLSLSPKFMFLLFLFCFPFVKLWWFSILIRLPQRFLSIIRSFLSFIDRSNPNLRALLLHLIIKIPKELTLWLSCFRHPPCHPSWRRGIAIWWTSSFLS